MRNVNLEENELTITAIFQQHTKEETIQTLKEALEVLEQEESDPENDSLRTTRKSCGNPTSLARACTSW